MARSLTDDAELNGGAVLMGRVQRNSGAFYAPLVAVARPSKLLNRHRGPGVGLYTVVEHSRQ